MCDEGSVPFPAPNGSVGCVAFGKAAALATSFLQSNMPPYDAVKAVSLFGVPGGVDGLDSGVASVGINASLVAKATYPWARDVPSDVYFEYVSAYSMLDEPRTNWRPFVSAVVQPLVADASTQEEAIAILNGYADANVSVWKALGGITFKSSQTPLIYDPISTAAFGYASCTGVSATFVATLRAVAIPARVAGTPAWLGNAANGNHNWIEVYNASSGQWHFIEGHPAGGSETLLNPCDKWFCNGNKFPPNSTVDKTTRVYAARFDLQQNDSSFILAWDPANLDIPADDRTAYYNEACSFC